MVPKYLGLRMMLLMLLRIFALFTAKSVYGLLFPATKRRASTACHVDYCICRAFIADLDACGRVVHIATAPMMSLQSVFVACALKPASCYDHR